MNRSFKRGFSLFVVLMLLICLMPVGVIAEETSISVDEGLQTSDIQMQASMNMSEFEQKLNQFQKDYGYYHHSIYNDESFSGASSCHGYARLLTRYIFGIDCGTYAYRNAGWVYHTDISQVCPGDLIRTGQSEYVGHTVFVTGVSGDTVTYTEANYQWGTEWPYNSIRWGVQKPKSSFTPIVYIAHYSANPVAVTPPVTSNNRIGALKTNGEVYVKEGGLDALWVGESNGAKQVIMSGNRIGVLGANGDFYVKEGGLDALWVKELTGVKQGVLSGNRIGALTENGDFYVKEGGLDAAWVTEYTGVKQGMLSGNQIGALATNGAFYVKEGGLDAAWVTELTDVKQGMLSGNRIGAIATNGGFYVKEGGLDGSWVTELTGVKQGMLSGNRIGALAINGDFYVKEGGLDGLWVTESTGAKQGLLSGNRIGVLGTNGDFYVKEGGLDALWVQELTDVKQGSLLDSNDSFMLEETIPLAGITINKTSLDLPKGSSEILTVSYTPTNTTDNKTITWNSSDPSVATVDSSGKVTALKAGSSNISAIVGSLKAECKINVSDANAGISCTYQTQIENIGWQGFKNEGEMSGTFGKGLRLEGIEINMNKQGFNLGVDYCTHVENFGWQDFVSNGAVSGTSGKGLRLEAIKIKLTGADADKFDIYYQVHAQNIGWLDWAKNGAESGTAGFGYRLEGIKIIVVPKGDPAPGATTRPFVQK